MKTKMSQITTTNHFVCVPCCSASMPQGPDIQSTWYYPGMFEYQAKMHTCLSLAPTPLLHVMIRGTKNKNNNKIDFQLMIVQYFELMYQSSLSRDQRIT